MRSTSCPSSVCVTSTIVRRTATQPAWQISDDPLQLAGTPLTSSRSLPSGPEQAGPVAVDYRLGMTGYEADIKPLFRERDRGSMLSHFDLWSFDDVVDNKDAILDRLADGDMPCDGPWPAERVEIFRSWIAAGTPA
jgi:hypothetical protein